MGPAFPPPSVKAGGRAGGVCEDPGAGPAGPWASQSPPAAAIQAPAGPPSLLEAPPAPPAPQAPVVNPPAAPPLAPKLAAEGPPQGLLLAWPPGAPAWPVGHHELPASSSSRGCVGAAVPETQAQHQPGSRGRARSGHHGQALQSSLGAGGTSAQLSPVCRASPSAPSGLPHVLPLESPPSSVARTRPSPRALRPGSPTLDPGL